MKDKQLFFKDNEKELQYIFCEEKRPFVLFLGAGINCSFSSELSWENMVKSLLKKSIQILSSSENINKENQTRILDKISSNEFNAYFKASIIKKALGTQYIGFIQDHLYSHCNINVIRSCLDMKGYPNNTNNSLLKIADLILSCENIKAVVTYNYDNFLTDAINILKEKKKNHRNIEPYDMYSSILENPLGKNSFPIYHVHGFIPPPNLPQVIVPNDVVLAYDEYFNNIMESYSWQTTTQLHFLNNYNALFFGTSLDDWNMLRALSTSCRYSKAVNHYALLSNKFIDNSNDTSKTAFLNKLKSSVLLDIAGIKSIISKTNGYSEQIEILTYLTNNK